MMDIDELKNEIHSRIPLTDYLQKATQGGYICPYCGSGDKGKHTGGLHIVKQNPYKFHCFACDRSGDVIDLIAKERGLETWDAMKWAAEYLGIDINKPQHAQEVTVKKNYNRSNMQQAETKKENSDYTAYYKKCMARIDAPVAVAYLQGRGISVQTAKAAGVGYDPQADPANNPGDMGLLPGKNPHPAPRIITPTSKSHYVGRRIDGVKSFEKMNPTGGSPWIFNVNALYTAPVVFVTEGIFDALAIMEVGGAAVATCSTSNVGNVIRQLKRKQSTVTLILALDNDNAGITATKAIKEELDKMGVLSLSVKLSDDGQDPNDALQKDRTAFTVKVHEAISNAYALKKEQEKRNTLTPDTAKQTLATKSQTGNVPGVESIVAQQVTNWEIAKEKYLQGNAKAHLDAFRRGIRENTEHPPIKTGFRNFDKLLDGGLYPGLYIIGAISSLGKTTFLLQIADSIAAQGIDVLYFSLEMAQDELIARSISRLTYTETAAQISALKEEIKKAGEKTTPFDGDPETRASLQQFVDRQTELQNLESARKSTRGILNGHRYAHYRRDEKALIERATDKYSTFAGHLYFSEGIGNIGVEQIREKIEQHYAFTGKYPVVMVDYLQILAPNDIRATDKQNTDKAVLELKRISRDCKTPVIAISSFNRDSYKGTNGIVAMTDFKESGAIEYSADILIGLEFQAAGAKADKKTGAEGYNEKVEKNKDPREIRAVIMKNRNGKAWVNKNFNYYPVFNYFEESAQTPPKNKGVQAEPEGDSSGGQRTHIAPLK